jgi:uncharacterized protein (TIGR02118 family)
MIKMSVLYPNQPDGTFDMDYYVTQHIPFVLSRCGSDATPGGIERGVAGGAPGSPAPYRVAAHLLFLSQAAMERSFGRYVQEILADLPNFTNIQPIVQISEVVL